MQERGAFDRILLTSLVGGDFGNADDRIDTANVKASRIVGNQNLYTAAVSYGKPKR